MPRTRDIVLQQMRQRSDDAMLKMREKEEGLSTIDNDEPLTAKHVQPVFESHREGTNALMQGQYTLAEIVLEANGFSRSFQLGPLKIKGFSATDVSRMLFACMLLAFLYLHAVDKGWAPAFWGAEKPNVTVADNE